MKKEQVVHAVNLACDGTAVRKYLEGQTLTIGEGCDVEMADAALPKGWCLVCVDGYSLGWGKAAGAILKIIIRKD